MHIFPTTQEDTNNQTMMYLSLSDGLYCPMNRLESEEFIKKWKEIPKQNEKNLMLVSLSLFINDVIGQIILHKNRKYCQKTSKPEHRCLFVQNY